MIEIWAILATASTFAKSFYDKAQDGFLSNQSDRTVLQIVGKVSDKLKTQTPADNHELAKAFRRACLVAAQHICDSRKSHITSQSSFAPQHKISSPLLGSTPTSLFAKDEQQWLEKAHQYLNNQIDDLNKDRVFLPEKDERVYESLINPSAVSKKVWANDFKQQMTNDMIAEVREAVGEASDSIIEELNSRWFLQSCNEFQKALSHNQILSNKFSNVMLVKLDSGLEMTIEILFEMFQFLRDSVNFQPKDLPKLVGRLTEKTLFVDRVGERDNLTEWLTQKSKKIIVVKAASGYGKTSLAMEVLHALAPDPKLLDERLDALLVFLCRDNEGEFSEVCKKADALLGKKEKSPDSFTNRLEEFAKETQRSTEILPDEIIKDVIDALAKLGNVWLVFDNFESVLLHYQIKENQLCAFFEKGLQTNGLHFLLTSQKVPEFAVPAEIKELEIGDLPDDFALEFLQTQGAKLKDEKIDCGLAETTLEDLHKLKELGFVCVPMALVALVGYLKANSRKYGETMARVVEDRQLFAKFREHDAKDPKEGSMYLIERQYLALTAAERLVLKAVSIFPNAVAFAVLLEILNEHSDEATIFGVLTGNTLVRRIGANFYELLPQANEVISKQSDKDDEKLTVQQLHLKAAIYYYSNRQPIAECYTPEQFALYFSAINHSIKAENYDAVVQIFNGAILKLNALGYMQEIIGRCRQVVGKLSEQELEANNFLNLGLALKNLGRLNEAVEENDKAIAMFEKLVNEQGRIDLANNLAGAYMNKGVALVNLGRLNEAVEEYAKAIAMFEKLVNEQGRIDLANNLAKAYVNKGVDLLKLGRLNEAVEEFDKAIAMLEELVNEQGRIDLANDLAKAYWGKGNVLVVLDKPDEAIDKYGEAIKLWDECLQRNELHILPNLFTVLYLRVKVLLTKEDWHSVAADTRRAFNLRNDIFEHANFSEHFKTQISGWCNDIIELIREVSPEKREEIYIHAGEDGEMIRRNVDES